MLEGLDGVELARIDRQEGRATVIYDAGRVDVDMMIEAVATEGFEATVAAR